MGNSISSSAFSKPSKRVGSKHLGCFGDENFDSLRPLIFTLLAENDDDSNFVFDSQTTLARLLMTSHHHSCSWLNNDLSELKRIKDFIFSCGLESGSGGVEEMERSLSEGDCNIITASVASMISPSQLFEILLKLALSPPPKLKANNNDNIMENEKIMKFIRMVKNLLHYIVFSCGGDCDAFVDAKFWQYRFEFTLNVLKLVLCIDDSKMPLLIDSQEEDYNDVEGKDDSFEIFILKQAICIYRDTKVASASVGIELISLATSCIKSVPLYLINSLYHLVAVRLIDDSVQMEDVKDDNQVKRFILNFIQSASLESLQFISADLKDKDPTNTATLLSIHKLSKKSNKSLLILQSIIEFTKTRLQNNLCSFAFYGMTIVDCCRLFCEMGEWSQCFNCIVAGDDGYEIYNSMIIQCLFNALWDPLCDNDKDINNNKNIKVLASLPWLSSSPNTGADWHPRHQKLIELLIKDEIRKESNYKGKNDFSPLPRAPWNSTYRLYLWHFHRGFYRLAAQSIYELACFENKVSLEHRLKAVMLAINCLEMLSESDDRWLIRVVCSGDDENIIVHSLDELRVEYLCLKENVSLFPPPPPPFTCTLYTIIGRLLEDGRLVDAFTLYKSHFNDENIRLQDCSKLISQFIIEYMHSPHLNTQTTRQWTLEAITRESSEIVPTNHLKQPINILQTILTQLIRGGARETRKFILQQWIAKHEIDSEISRWLVDEYLRGDANDLIRWVHCVDADQLLKVRPLIKQTHLLTKHCQALLG